MSERNRRMLQQRAAAHRSNPEPPNSLARSVAFPAQMRAETVIWKGQERKRLDGTASVTEKRYPMYDMFGEYDEVVDQNAFEDTLKRHPDVAYLTNHRGLTMARTVNETLMLSADSKGLQTEAYVNPKRHDVSDLVTAIEDGEITEMSFAFRIDDGEWSDDYTEYRILKVDLDRGDVSAVNYGANPYTSVAARQAEVMSDLRKLPEGAQRAAVAEMRRHLAEDGMDLDGEPIVELERGDDAAEEVREQQTEEPTVEGPQGSSVKLMKIRLAMLED